MPYDPYSDVKKAQDLSRESVQGFGETLKPGLLREIGTALGGLNSIGALRSGGANVALGDIATNYSQMIGNFAKESTGQAIGYGLEAQRLRQEKEAANQRRKGGLLKAIGGVLGAGIGFLVGGPGGAAAGLGIGSGAGGGGGPSNYSGDPYNPFPNG